MVECINQRKSHFLLLYIYSDRLADFLLAIVEKIIFDLESHTDLFPKVTHFLNHLLSYFGGSCSNRTAGGTKTGCFLSDDGVIHLLGDVQLTSFGNLQQLALTHFLHCMRNDF